MDLPMNQSDFIHESMRKNYELALRLLQSGKISVSELYTVMNYKEAQKAFDDIYEKREKKIGKDYSLPYNHPAHFLALLISHTRECKMKVSNVKWPTMLNDANRLLIKKVYHMKTYFHWYSLYFSFLKLYLHFQEFIVQIPFVLKC